jgi:hypothetical protein
VSNLDWLFDPLEYKFFYRKISIFYFANHPKTSLYINICTHRYATKLAAQVTSARLHFFSRNLFLHQSESEMVFVKKNNKIRDGFRQKNNKIRDGIVWFFWWNIVGWHSEFTEIYMICISFSNFSAPRKDQKKYNFSLQYLSDHLFPISFHILLLWM